MWIKNVVTLGIWKNGKEKGRKKSKTDISQSTIAGAFIQTWEYLHSLQRNQSALTLKHALWSTLGPWYSLFN